MINKNLEKLKIWNYLTEDQKRKVIDSAYVRTFNKNESIADMSNSCLGLLFIISGSIRVSILSNEGREATLFQLEEDDMCVLSASCVIKQIHFETVMQAKEEAKVLIIDSSTVDLLMKENIKVRCCLYELTIERFSQALWVLQEVLFERFDKRLARYLINVSEENNSLIIYNTQEEIAKDVSSSREVVSRMLKNFSNEGIIEIRRGNIKILDMEELRKIENE